MGCVTIAYRFALGLDVLILKGKQRASTFVREDLYGASFRYSEQHCSVQAVSRPADPETPDSFQSIVWLEPQVCSLVRPLLPSHAHRQTRLCKSLIPLVGPKPPRLCRSCPRESRLIRLCDIQALCREMSSQAHSKSEIGVRNMVLVKESFNCEASITTILRLSGRRRTPHYAAPQAPYDLALKVYHSIAAAEGVASDAVHSGGGSGLLQCLVYRPCQAAQQT